MCSLTSNTVTKPLSIMSDDHISIRLLGCKVEGRSVNVDIGEVVSFHWRICEVGSDPMDPFSGRRRALAFGYVELETLISGIYKAAITAKVEYVSLSLLEFWWPSCAHVGNDLHVDGLHGHKKIIKDINVRDSG